MDCEHSGPATYVKSLYNLDYGLPLHNPQPLSGKETKLGEIGYIARGSFLTVFNATSLEGLYPSQQKQSELSLIPASGSDRFPKQKKTVQRTAFFSEGKLWKTMDKRAALPPNISDDIRCVYAPVPAAPIGFATRFENHHGVQGAALITGGESHYEQWNKDDVLEWAAPYWRTWKDSFSRHKSVMEGDIRDMTLIYGQVKTASWFYKTFGFYPLLLPKHPESYDFAKEYLKKPDSVNFTASGIWGPKDLNATDFDIISGYTSVFHSSAPDKDKKLQSSLHALNPSQVSDQTIFVRRIKYTVWRTFQERLSSYIRRKITALCPRLVRSSVPKENYDPLDELLTYIHQAGGSSSAGATTDDDLITLLKLYNEYAGYQEDSNLGVLEIPKVLEVLKPPVVIADGLAMLALDRETFDKKDERGLMFKWKHVKKKC